LSGFVLNQKIIPIALLIIVLSVGLISTVYVKFPKTNNPFPSDVYVGVTADGNVTTTLTLIDKTKDFTNLLIINNPNVVRNKSSLTEVCNNAQQAGQSFFVFMAHPGFWQFDYNPFDWVSEAKEDYGKHFLGIYLYDEPGGNQLDLGAFRQYDKENYTPLNYRDAAQTYVYFLYIQMRDFIKIDKLVTSDYALFWFDYEAGYDAIFCEFGSNRIKEINIPLCRGAAEMHNKTWGIMITWKYEHPPYIESADELYYDMITAYEAGAKYIVVFNHPETGPFGLLTEEHFSAIKKFKDFVSKNPRNRTSNTRKLAYVLPENYGWGLRNPSDKIWGLWEADEKSPKIWSDLHTLIEKHDHGFDIVYDSPWTRFFAKHHYDTLFWWNGTIQALDAS
jgi:hypothetical protein